MSDGPNTRARILETAITLLETDGEGGLRIDRLAEVAHVSKQSLYTLFGDREGLIIAAQAEQYRRILAGFDDLADGLLSCLTVDDYARLVLSVASAGVNHGAERRRLRVQALGAATTRESLRTAIREAHRSAITSLSKIATFGQLRGWITTAYPATAISELWFLMITGFHVAETYATPDDVALTGRAAVDALSYLLFGRAYPEYNTAHRTDELGSASSAITRTPLTPTPGRPQRRP